MNVHGWFHIFRLQDHEFIRKVEQGKPIKNESGRLTLKCLVPDHQKSDCRLHDITLYINLAVSLFTIYHTIYVSRVWEEPSQISPLHKLEYVMHKRANPVSTKSNDHGETHNFDNWDHPMGR